MKPIRLDPLQRQELERRRHETRDKRIYARLSAVLWVADGKTRSQVAGLLGCSVRQLAEWLRLFRNRGLGTRKPAGGEDDRPWAARAGRPRRVPAWTMTLFTERVCYEPWGVSAA